MVLSRFSVVVLLFCISLFTYIDRWSAAAILNDLQAPPDPDGGLGGGFGLTDTDGGLVTSVFVITYMILSPVFGYLGDRTPRIPLLFVGILIWSVSTFLASFSTHFWQFLFFRSLLGVGEASYAVLAPTIIADLYPAGPERTRVLGYYCTSIPLGSALGYVYAGEVARVLSWRYAFRFSPVLSLALSAILLLCVTEPERGFSDSVASLGTSPSSRPPNHTVAAVEPAAKISGASISNPANPIPPRRLLAQSPDQGASLSEPRSGGSALVAFLRDAGTVLRTRSFLFCNIGAIGMTFTAGALAQWAPSYLQRVNCSGLDAFCEARVTRTFGLITISTGILGTLSGAGLSRWYSKRSAAADAVVCGMGLLFATPCVYFAIYMAPTLYYVTWASIFGGEWLVSLVWAPYTAILLSVVPPSLRGTANSISLLTMHLFGDSMSPLLVGVAADAFHQDGDGLSRAASLQSALYLSVVSTVVGSLFFLYGGVFLQADRANALGAGEYALLPGKEVEVGGRAEEEDAVAAAAEEMAGGRRADAQSRSRGDGVALTSPVRHTRENRPHVGLDSCALVDSLATTASGQR